MMCAKGGDECRDPEACLQGMFSCETVRMMNMPDLDNRAEMERNLTAWWRRVASEDANAVIPKAIEYGSADFDIMGAAMLNLKSENWVEADPGERLKIAQEMAILFYILGKAARALSAYSEGRLPSDDTLADLVRYGMMARHVRTFGKWV